MTIREWLTPDLFAAVVILVTLVTNMTIYGIVSNYTVDGKIRPSFQFGTYAAGIVMTVAYAFLILLYALGAIDNRPTLYPNKYDFLLMGTDRALACAVLGVVAGTVFGYMKRDDAPRLRGLMGAGALACEALIGAGVVLWIISQE